MSLDNFDALWRALPRFGEGILITFELTVGGAALAFIIAIVFGLLARNKNIILRGFARTVIEFFRGTSLVVQVFWFYYVMPHFGVDWSPMLSGIVALALNYGAYSAEIVRGSINAVPTGQWEASTALSISPFSRMRRIIFPQGWALMIPSLNNMLIQLLKGSAIVSFITLHDLTYATDKLRIDTNTFFAYGIGALVYFAIAYAFTLCMNALEIHAKHKLGMGDSLRKVLSFRTPPSNGSDTGAPDKSDGEKVPA